jgi:hypothetical protein
MQHFIRLMASDAGDVNKGNTKYTIMKECLIIGRAGSDGIISKLCSDSNG